MSRFARYPLRHRRPVRAPHRPCVLITIIAALFSPPGHVGATDAATARTTARTTDATYHLPGLDAPAEIILDVGRWDAAEMTNAPGQSGDPDSPFYRNLLDGWASDSSFPLLYSRAAVMANQALRIELLPEYAVPRMRE